MMQRENVERYLDAIEKVMNGATWKEAGNSIGTSGEYVIHLWHKNRMLMMHEKRLDEPLPDHDYRKVKCIRLHKDFWLKRLKKLRTEIRNKYAY